MSSISASTVSSTAMPPPGISPISSLDSCEENSCEESCKPISAPQRPKLAPPKENYLLGVHQRLERMANAQANEDLDELKNLDEEKGEVLRKEMEATKLRRNTWSILKTVADYVASASSIVFGPGLGPGQRVGQEDPLCEQMALMQEQWDIDE